MSAMIEGDASKRFENLRAALRQPGGSQLSTVPAEYAIHLLKCIDDLIADNTEMREFIERNTGLNWETIRDDLGPKEGND